MGGEPVVNAFNEWDPLEEIIIGRVDDNSLIPPWDTIMPAVIHDKSQWGFYKSNSGKPWPKEMLAAARKDIEELIHILETEGVMVRHPDEFRIGDIGVLLCMDLTQIPNPNDTNLDLTRTHGYLLVTPLFDSLIKSSICFTSGNA